MPAERYNTAKQDWVFWKGQRDLAVVALSRCAAWPSATAPKLMLVMKKQKWAACWGLCIGDMANEHHPTQQTC